MPDVVEQHRLDARLERQQHEREAMRLAAQVDRLEPVLTMQRPVRVEERSRHGVLELRQTESQRRRHRRLIAVHVADPLEVAERGEAELVREVLSLDAFLVVLVFVEGERVGRVLVLVRPVRVLHTCVYGQRFTCTICTNYNYPLEFASLSTASFRELRQVNISVIFYVLDGSPASLVSLRSWITMYQATFGHALV